MSTACVRRISETEVPTVMSLLLKAAQQRHEFEPNMWPLHPYGEQRTHEGLLRDFQYPEHVARFVAECEGQAVGTASSGCFPSPPVYAELIAGQTDLFSLEQVALSPLLKAAEAFQASSGASLHSAVCAAHDEAKLAFLRSRDYHPLTNWKVRQLNGGTDLPVNVRKAKAEDVEGMVRLQMANLEEKRRANARFWTPHAEAATRFGQWMHRSLTLTDRDMLVSEKDGRVNGFVIVQPTPHVPPAHDAAHIATVDDLAAEDWATMRDLIHAAQFTATQQGKTMLQIISPANWPEKNALLDEEGFHTANLWLLKD